MVTNNRQTTKTKENTLTTNNRGKPLSKLELLKNRLIYLTTIIPNYDQDDDESIFVARRKKIRHKINNAWKVVYEFLGKNQKNRLNDDEFLRNHFYMYYGYDTDTASVVDRILLEDKFTAKDALSRKISFEDIEKYTTSLEKAAVNWFRIKNPIHPEARFSPEVALWLEKLRRENYPPFFVCLMTVLIKKVSDNIFLELVKTMERYFFLVFGLSRRKSNTGISLFYQRAHHVWRGTKTIFDLKNEIETRTKEGHDTSMVRFKNKLTDLFGSSNAAKAGFYGWTELNYFLHEYELGLQGDEELKTVWHTGKNTVEHIYPKDDNRGCWQEHFGEFNTVEKWYLLHNLGNLLLLSRSKNSALSNRCFGYKKRHENNGNEEGFFNGSHSEIEVNKESEWTPNSILERGLKMFEFIESRWNIKIGDRERKTEILGLGFLNEKEDSEKEEETPTPDNKEQ